MHEELLALDVIFFALWRCFLLGLSIHVIYSEQLNSQYLKELH